MTNAPLLDWELISRLSNYIGFLTLTPFFNKKRKFLQTIQRKISQKDRFYKFDDLKHTSLRKLKKKTPKTIINTIYILFNSVVGVFLNINFGF